MKPVAPGAHTTLEIIPGASDTAAAVGNAGIDVVATTVLILYIEETSGTLVAPYYEAGEATVGVRVEVDHLAPARVGTAVKVRAELQRVRGRRLMFANEVHQGETLIMKGFHHRSVVSMANFSQSTPGSMASAADIEFWFDFHSPWCYLAASRIAAIAHKHGARLRWRPVHLANLIDAIGGRRPLEANPAFVSWYRQDIVDQAGELRLPYRPHPDYPLRPSRALRAALHASEMDQAATFVPAVMRAYWAEGRDISDPQVLAELAEGSSLNAQRAMAAVTDPRYKQALQSNLQDAISQQVFGVPTVVVDGKRFFGNDHLDLLERYLARRS